MRHTEEYFVNLNGQNNYYQEWFPDEPFKAILFLVHGIAEYSGYFTSKGYLVVGLDHLGHGKSAGFPLYTTDFNLFVSPIKNRLIHLKERCPEIPCYLLGHSMGGLIASQILIEQQDLVKAAIISCPLLTVPNSVTWVELLLGKFMAKLWPNLGVG